MLGRLVTWLRILGCDVVYNPRMEDEALIQRALAEDRILLTRDRRLAVRRAIRERVFLVEPDRYPEQLRQVVEHFRIDPEAGFLTRCVRCNEPLRPVEKAQVRARVPSYVYQTQETFATCPACGRLYWEATHCDHMRAHLRRFLNPP